METMTLPDNLTEQVQRFRETTNLSVVKLAQLADLSPSAVSNVANAKPGQRFAEETEHRLREAMANYLRDHVLDVSALLGEISEADPEIDDVVAKVTAKRRR